MTCTIGRVGVATGSGGDGLSLTDPFDWKVNGRQVTITGRHVAATDAAATWFAEQIMGLDPALNLDEPSIPFTSTAVPTLNGFYSVDSAQAEVGRGALGTGTRFVDWQVSMRRAVDSAKPRIEIPHAYAFLTNSLSATLADNAIGYPQSGTLLRQSFLPNSRPSVATEHGNIYWPYQQNGASQVGQAAYYAAQYHVTPGSYYAGGVRIYGANGNAVGRRDLVLATGAPGTGLTISNGRVRISLESTTEIKVSWFNNPAWSPGLAFKIQETTGAYQHTYAAATVIKNAPDECILRLVSFYDDPTFYGTTPAPRSGTVDISIRRGDRIARIAASSIYTAGWKLYSSAGTMAATSATGGIRSTSAVDGSLYIIMASNNAATRDLANLALSSTGTAKTLFGLGLADSVGSPAGNWGGTDSLIAQFFYTHATTQRVVVG